MTFARSYEMDLNVTVKDSKTGKGEYKKVGSIKVPFPTLADCGITAAIKKDEKGADTYTDSGVPIYESAVADFIQGAILAATLNKARSRFDKEALKKGEIKLNPGMVVATNFDELTAESERTGEALALRRDARVSFEAFLRSLNKEDKVVTRLGDLFWNSSKVLATVSPNYLKAITQYSERWVASLTPEQAARFAPKIEELQESINAASTEDDLMAEGTA